MIAINLRITCGMWPFLSSMNDSPFLYYFAFARIFLTNSIIILFSFINSVSACSYDDDFHSEKLSLCIFMWEIIIFAKRRKKTWRLVILFHYQRRVNKILRGEGKKKFTAILSGNTSLLQCSSLAGKFSPLTSFFYSWFLFFLFSKKNETNYWHLAHLNDFILSLLIFICFFNFLLFICI